MADLGSRHLQERLPDLYNDRRQQHQLVWRQPEAEPGGRPDPQRQSISEWFNTAAFAQPAPFTFGNAPRYMGNVRAPGMEDFDIGIQKWFRYRDALRLQFRAEMFNAFNRANFYAPDGNLTDPTFGVISATLPPRDIQMGLKLYW